RRRWPGSPRTPSGSSNGRSSSTRTTGRYGIIRRLTTIASPSAVRPDELDVEFGGRGLLGQTPPALGARAAFAGDLGRAGPLDLPDGNPPPGRGEGPEDLVQRHVAVCPLDLGNARLARVDPVS